MSPGRPTRETVAGRAYLDLQNLARRQGRPTDELQQLYALEGFLARLAGSPYADRLVLKGGALLAAYDARRPTRDVDVQAAGTSNQVHDVLQLIRAVVSVQVDDGLVFDPVNASAEVIRDDDEYSGVRVSLTARFATARLSMHVDVNVGDPIWPAPHTVELPRLLGGTIVLPGYPLPMVYAEKITTALQRGTANTSWRDFADIYLLTGRHPADGGEVQQTLVTQGGYRRAELAPLAAALGGYAALGQQRWVIWRRRQRLEDRLPASFAQVLADVIAFADPASNRQVTDRKWAPSDRTSR